AWMLEQYALDFERGDVLAAADDDVLLAVGNGKEAVRVHASHVAGEEPAAGQERAGVEAVIHVAKAQLGPARRDFPLFTHWQVTSVVIQYPHLVARGQLAVRGQALFQRIGGPSPGDGGVFGRSV